MLAANDAAFWRDLHPQALVGDGDLPSVPTRILLRWLKT